MDIISSVSHSVLDHVKDSVNQVQSSLKIHPCEGEELEKGSHQETKVDITRPTFAGRKGIATTANYMKAPRVVFKGHKQSVISLGILRAPGQNDTLILSGSEDKLMKVWSLVTGELLATLSGHKQRVSGAVGYADEHCPPVAISASADDTLRIWPMETCFGSQPVDCEDIYKRSVSLLGFKNRVLGLVAMRPYAEDDPFVAGCSADNTVQVWSLPKGEPLFVLVDKSEVTWNLCLACLIIPQKPRRRVFGPVLITGCKNNIVRIWRARTPVTSADGISRPDRVIRGAHTTAVQSVAAFVYQGDPHLVTACKDLDIRIFSIDSSQLLRSMKGHTSTILSVAAICPTADRALIVSSSVEGRMCVWKYSNDENDLGGELLRIFNGHTDEINEVEVMVTPEPDKDDIVIVSGSKDQSVRTWLFVDEKNLNLRVIDPKLSAGPADDDEQERAVRINAMDVYSVAEDAWIVTGGDDGCLRMWCIRQDDVDLTDDLKWCVQAHQTLIVAVTLYVPLDEVVNQVNANGSSFYPAHLNKILIMSGGRDGCIRISDFQTGEAVCPVIQAHPSPITSLCVFPGRGPVDGLSLDDIGIAPFLVSGSEDNCAKVWQLTDNSCHYVLEGLHDLDVTAVAVFLPRPAPKLTRKDMMKTPKTWGGSPGSPLARASSARPSAAVPGGFAAFGAMSSIGAVPSNRSPLIITGSEDTSVSIWSYLTGELIETLNDSPAIITAVAVIEPQPSKPGVATEPIVAAGNVDGAIFVWSLRAPYKLLHVFTGHTDEVTMLDAFDAEGLYPVLVSASLDTTVRVWNLKEMKFQRTIEGHKDDVMAVKIFKSGAFDPALATGSVDCTVRVLFDFLGSVANVDFVMQEFKFDMEGTNSHILVDSSSKWPRIAHKVRTEGADVFFKSYYRLFGQALRAGRSDFLVEFLPLTRLGLLKSNSEMEDGDADDGRGGLLRQAINLKDTVAVHILVECWCSFLTKAPTGPNDILYDPGAQINREDMLLLAVKYPKEFEKLVCSVKLMPTKNNSLPPGALFMSTDKDGGMIVNKYETFVDLSAVIADVPHRRASMGSIAGSERSDLYTATQAGESVKDGITSVKNRQRSYTLFLASENKPPGAQISPIVSPPSPNTSYKISSAKRSMSMKVGTSQLIGNNAGGNLDEQDVAAQEYQLRAQKFLYIPLEGAVHMDMINAYCTCCEKLDSVKIFDSEAGQLALSYAWHTFGIKAYKFKMYVYFFYVAISTASTLTFEIIKGRFWYASLFLIVVQLCINAYFVRSEGQQYMTGIIEYLVDIWNFFDFSVIMGSTAANVLRLIYWEDTLASRILLCVTSIFMWFNILYYLRAYEETGPLVSMVLKISDDVKYLILVVVLVLIGFSQAFYLLSYDEENSFSSMDQSLLLSFTFMLGEYDPFAFTGAKLESFAVFLSTIYMMILSILLLNLLIAYMADSYSAVKAKGLAQWKLQQAQIIKEMQGSMSDNDRHSMAVVYFRKLTEDSAVDDEAGEESGPAALEERCSRIESTLDALKEHLIGSNDNTGSVAGPIAANVKKIHSGGSAVDQATLETTMHDLKLEMQENARQLQEELLDVSKQQNELNRALRIVMNKLGGD